MRCRDDFSLGSLTEEEVGMGVDHRRPSAYPRRVPTRPWQALPALLLLLLTATPAAPAAPPPTEDSPVFVIVLENREYEEVFESPEAPFLNALARRETQAAYYYAVTHPSLPNYLAILGGSTFGISSNCTDCTARGDNLALQLSRARISWRAYMGSMPRPCFRGEEAGRYVKRHDPFMYFPSIAENPVRCRQVVPAARLDADLRRQSLPAFGWLSPDLCDDGHDCDLATADRYLSRLVPRIMRQLGPAGTLVVTFDEGTSEAACCRPFERGGGGHVLTILARPGQPLGHRTVRTYDHYSLLAGIERHFNLPRLRGARQAKALPIG